MPGVHLEIDGGIAVLTVDNPGKKNALTIGIAEELTRHCDEIDARDDVGAVVVRGADGTFSSGADTAEWRPDQPAASEQAWQYGTVVYGSFRRVGALRAPVIAAVRGAAVGAGLNLMLAADVRIVSNEARLLAGFIRAGITPGGGFFTLVNRLAGPETAIAMALFGEEVRGADAVARGLAWAAVPDAEVEPLALELAAAAARDPIAVRRSLALARQELGPPGVSWDAAIQMERGLQMWSQHRRANPEPGT